MPGITNDAREPSASGRRASDGTPPEARRSHPRCRKLLWFVLLWIAGIVVSGAVAYTLKYLLWLVEPR